jgi:hypothetical protein
MRILAFVLALLLLDGTVDPTQGWLITLVVLTGIAAFRLFRPWSGVMLRPALDVRMASFVLAVLLLAGSVDATKDWLIALSAVTGVAAFMPHIVSLDRQPDHWRWMRIRGRRRYGRGWALDWEGDDWR